ncbi:MAG: hypothetical protein LN414_05520, partial [Candidatus Thermoplasmatota archaeon]|nr:hypothetical protein [Candidatus Thermoplasmatota archaeon]
GMGMITGSMERIEMIEEAMAVGGVSGTLTWEKSGDAIEGANLKDSMGTTVATTDAEGAYVFWAPAEEMAYNIYDAESALIGTAMIGGTAQQNATKDISLVKVSGGDDDDDDDDEGITTLSYVFIGIIVLLIIILIATSMMGKKE